MTENNVMEFCQWLISEKGIEAGNLSEYINNNEEEVLKLAEEFKKPKFKVGGKIEAAAEMFKCGGKTEEKQDGGRMSREDFKSQKSSRKDVRKAAMNNYGYNREQFYNAYENAKATYQNKGLDRRSAKIAAQKMLMNKPASNDGDIVKYGNVAIVEDIPSRVSALPKINISSDTLSGLYSGSFYDHMSFKDAFKAARTARLNSDDPSDKTFSWRGKMYGTDIKPNVVKYPGVLKMTGDIPERMSAMPKIDFPSPNATFDGGVIDEITVSPVKVNVPVTRPVNRFMAGYQDGGKAIKTPSGFIYETENGYVDQNGRNAYLDEGAAARRSAYKKGLEMFRKDVVKHDIPDGDIYKMSTFYPISNDTIITRIMPNGDLDVEKNGVKTGISRLLGLENDFDKYSKIFKKK